MPYFGKGGNDTAEFRQLAVTPGDAESSLSPSSQGEEAEIVAVRRRTFVRSAQVALLGVVVLAAVAVAARHLSPEVRLHADQDGLQQLEEDEIPCTDGEEDCSESKCCTTPGWTCFEKNQWWATCIDKCTPGVPRPNDMSPQAWSCTPLGEPAPEPLTCAWAGKDCSETNTCCQRGFACMVKDEFWSACAQVESGPWNPDGTPLAIVPKPKGWKGTKLGGWREEQAVEPQPGGATIGTTLFCFMAILTGSSEEELVDLAWDRKAGIFGCEDSRIYHSASSQFQKWETGQKTLVNTDIFVEIWRDVKVEGKYKEQDWTVKADADCIFFPDRLRAKLEALSLPADTPMYVKNTLPRYTNGGFLGAIEVFSKQAVEKFVGHADECAKHIGLKSGEDGFLKDCMDALGIGFTVDELIMHPSGLPEDCQVKEFAAYHPFKSLNNWTVCYNWADGVGDPPPPLWPGSIALLPDSIKGEYQPAPAAPVAPAVVPVV